MIQQDIPPQLRWACRRGMLELDIILLRFLEYSYLHLSPAEQALFSQLLECNDQDLFRWLLSKETQPEEHLQSIVEKIRAYALSGL
ncbi:MAG: hypothetical protein A3E84_01335 [Gammaproteobacteria bacterium RIFCSPHIGHO2_12_FULL_42_13]|nr:MAG: hypothetical protein A3E84_01335 [Gammaproteobacteria bacterium RIFCSPHIGHO2_12_FULL_42_13]